MTNLTSTQKHFKCITSISFYWESNRKVNGKVKEITDHLTMIHLTDNGRVYLTQNSLHSTQTIPTLMKKMLRMGCQIRFWDFKQQCGIFSSSISNFALSRLSSAYALALLSVAAWTTADWRVILHLWKHNCYRDPGLIVGI